MVLFDKKESQYKGKKSLILYFSRADENYAVGFIDKGNTEVIAEYIKDLTGGDMFKVERKIPYAKDYNTCIKQAQIEQEKNERPEELGIAKFALKQYYLNIEIDNITM